MVGDQRQAVGGEGTAELGGLLRWQVDQQHAVDAGRHRLPGEALGAADLDRVEVAHQHNRCIGIVLAEAAHAVEHEG